MDAFPFTSDDWELVKDNAHPVLEAQLADDDVLVESMFLILQETLHELRSKYGDHPVLLETEADFCDNRDDSIRLYQRALNIARGNSLPTGSICLSYAHVLLEEACDVDAVRRLLESCRQEVLASGDESDIEQYNELMTLLESADRDTTRNR